MIALGFGGSIEEDNSLASLGPSAERKKALGTGWMAGYETRPFRATLIHRAFEVGRGARFALRMPTLTTIVLWCGWGSRIDCDCARIGGSIEEDNSLASLGPSAEWKKASGRDGWPGVKPGLSARL